MNYQYFELGEHDMLGHARIHIRANERRRLLRSLFVIIFVPGAAGVALGPLVALVLALVRAMRGPTAFDRLLSVNAIGTTVILGIALHGYVMGRPEFVDISILYAIINFIGTFAVLKLFDTGGLGDDGGRARPDLSSNEEGK